MPDQQVVLDLPPLPVSRRRRQYFLYQSLILPVVARIDGSLPRRYAVATDFVELVDALGLPPRGRHTPPRLHLPGSIAEFLRRQDARRYAARRTCGRLARERRHVERRRQLNRSLLRRLPRRQGEGHDQARLAELQAVSARGHGPFVSVAVLAITRVVRLELLQQKALLFE